MTIGLNSLGTYRLYGFIIYDAWTSYYYSDPLDHLWYGIENIIN